MVSRTALSEAPYGRVVDWSGGWVRQGGRFAKRPYGWVIAWSGGWVRRGGRFPKRPYGVRRPVAFDGFSRSNSHASGLFTMYSRVKPSSRSLRITRS